METKTKKSIGIRTGIDFSKHELNVYENKTDDKTRILVHHLELPNSVMNNIRFVNTNGIMFVTGDFGNWMFCREFHPSAEGHVSDGYWHEKLGVLSSQEGREFDSEGTKEEIERGLSSGLVEYGYEGDRLEQMKEYYDGLLNYVECSEWEYEAYAYNNFPSFEDTECVPNVKKTKNWLAIIFDGFDEICSRLKEE